MDEMTKIRNLLLQNQKIIRYASENVSFPASFSEDFIRDYEETEKAIKEFEINYEKIVFRFRRFNSNVETYFENTSAVLQLGVKKKDVVSKLNTELSLGKHIELIGKRFLVNTKHLTINESGMRFKGTVNATTGSLGGFTISGNTLVGAENTAIGSGTIEAHYMNLRGATAENIDCNPDNIQGKPVTMTSNRRVDKESKESSTTSFKGELYVSGVIDATYGWNQEVDSDGVPHGTLPNFSFDVLHVKGACTLAGRSGAKTPANRARCSEIFNETGESWSDIRLKEGIKDIDGEKVLSLFRRLRPVEYQLKGNADRKIGYIAQELDKAFKDSDLPSIVRQEGEYLTVPYAEMIPLRVKMIQELYRRIKDGNKGKGTHEGGGTA